MEMMMFGQTMVSLMFELTATIGLRGETCSQSIPRSPF